MFGLFRRKKKLIEVPKYSGKVGFTELADYQRHEFGPDLAELSADRVIFTRERDGLRYDFALARKRKADRLFVLFSGAADRRKVQPPVFQRWKWADRFPGHVLYVSDPALFHDSKLGLAWYIGVGDKDPLPVIAETVQTLAGYLGLGTDNVIFYGSSGGGFASLRMQNFIQGTASVAINPQITISRYNKGIVNRYLTACHNARFDQFDFVAHRHRFDLLASPMSINQRLILVQNTVDKSHYRKHFTPFCELLGIPSAEPVQTGAVRTILFSHERGHLQAETSEVFTQIMSSI